MIAGEMLTCRKCDRRYVFLSHYVGSQEMCPNCKAIESENSAAITIGNTKQLEFPWSVASSAVRNPNECSTMHRSVRPTEMLEFTLEDGRKITIVLHKKSNVRVTVKAPRSVMIETAKRGS